MFKETEIVQMKCYKISYSKSYFTSWRGNDGQQDFVLNNVCGLREQCIEDVIDNKRATIGNISYKKCGLSAMQFYFSAV